MIWMATWNGLNRFDGKRISFTDRQGQLWQLHPNEVLCQRESAVANLA